MRSSKLYLDCTHTYNSGLHTGIQRVVKNIVANVAKVQNELDVEIIPIILKNDQYFKFESFPKIDKKKNIIKVVLKNAYLKLRAFSSFVLPKKIYQVLYAPAVNIYLSTLIDKILFSKKIDIQNVIGLKSTDTLILMDAIWLHNDYKRLSDLKKNNIKIIALVYDIIPITHPQFCTIDLTLFLKDWYINSLQYIDGYIAISKSVQEDVFKYIKDNLDENIEVKKFDYFYLGASFLKENHSKSVSKEFQNIFKDKNVFLTVSTIEPRKNHKYILDTFEVLWDKDIDLKYVIIGKIGWNTEPLVSRIKSHKYYNKKLFLLNDVDDLELVYAYKNSKALIFSSFVEGFGLPIMESLFYKLPVIASNIKIHQEIGKNNISYCDLLDSNSLLTIIESENIKQVDNFVWQDWFESTKELILKSRGF